MHAKVEIVVMVAIVPALFVAFRIPWYLYAPVAIGYYTISYGYRRWKQNRT